MPFMALLVSVLNPRSISHATTASPQQILGMMNMVLPRLRNANYCGLGFSIDAGYDELMAGSCTSCQVTQDKSSYWTAALYFQDASGQISLVDQVGGMLAYVISPL
jgi:hypothetical protein